MRLLLAFCAALLFGGAALAAPTFPPLTGRVVDNANILSPATEQQMTAKLQTLEQQTTRQVVVVTLPDLQGYEIEEYGYQLGRHWKIGQAKEDNGALFIVAPSDRKVRIEVGYGLEPVITDALSSVILQEQVLPRFRDGDMEAGVVAGTDAIVQQLSLPDDQAKAVVAQAAVPAAEPGIPPFAMLFIMFMIFMMLSGMFGRRRRRGLASALPWIILSGMGSGGGRSDWSGGGGFGGGGGFSGGGGSFGGGGASGGW